MPFPDFGIREPPDSSEQDDKFRPESDIDAKMAFVHPPDAGQFVPDGIVTVAFAAAVESEAPGINCELVQSTNATALAVLDPGGAVHEGAESSRLLPVPVIGHGSGPAESPVLENCTQTFESEL